jgi:hypothetical protein
MRGSYDLYAVLGLSHGATGDEIKAAYWALAKQHHPDVNAGDGEAERRIKEIIGAYETLGDPEVRAAYDLELARQRASARRTFWSGAATGAATFVLTVSTVWLAVMWRQNAPIRQAPGGEAAVLASNESPAARQPVQDPDNLGPAAPEADRGDGPAKTVMAALPGPFGETPSWVARELASASLAYRDTRMGGEAASPPSATLEPPISEQPREVVASISPPEPAGELQLPDGQQAPPPARAEDTPERSELANAVPLAVAPTQQMPAPAVEQKPIPELTRRDADRKAAAVARFQKKSGRQLNMTERAENVRSDPQGLDRGRPVVARTAAALRWPSADEPFVNLGGRNR